MGLLVPRRVALEDEADRINAEVDAQVQAARVLSEDLKRIDPTLSIVWAPQGSVDLTPERWHIRKRVAGSVDEYWPLEGPNGEYREPGSWVLDNLQASDLWNPRVHRSKQEAKEKLRAARNRAKARQAEQRHDEMLAARRAAKRLRGDGGFTRSSAAKRRGEGLKGPASRIELPPGVRL